MQRFVIKEELTYLDQDKIEVFLIYLYKSLQDNNLINWRGEGSFIKNEDGGVDFSHFLNKDKISISPNGTDIFEIEFVSYWNNGSLERIEAGCKNTSRPNTFIDVMGKCVSVAFASAYSGKLNSYFFRSLFAYIGPRLDGVYYIHNWRISPASPDTGSDVLSEQILYIDMDVEGINRTHAQSNFHSKSLEIISVLSTILNIGIYKIPLERRWCYVSGKDSQLYQLGFCNLEPYPEQMPEKDKTLAGQFYPVERLFDLGRTVGEKLRLPQNIRKIFAAYNVLEPKEKSAFLNSCRMYHLSLSTGRYYKTICASYQIAALDALAILIRENNRNKNAILGMITRYCPGFEEVVAKLYESVRSAHFHQGMFLEMDTMGFEIGPFTGPKNLYQDHELRNLAIASRNVILKWIIEKIQEQ